MQTFVKFANFNQHLYSYLFTYLFKIYLFIHLFLFTSYFNTDLKLVTLQLQWSGKSVSTWDATSGLNSSNNDQKMDYVNINTALLKKDFIRKYLLLFSMRYVIPYSVFLIFLMSKTFLLAYCTNEFMNSTTALVYKNYFKVILFLVACRRITFFNVVSCCQKLNSIMPRWPLT